MRYPEPVYLAHVLYRDYRRAAQVSRYDLRIPAFVKRRSFEHEREVRAVVWQEKLLEDSDWNTLSPETPKGLAVPVDLKQLIHRIYVSPNASDQFLATVEGLVGGAFPVHRSKMDAEMPAGVRLIEANERATSYESWGPR